MLAFHDGETDDSTICEDDAEDAPDLDATDIGAVVVLAEAKRELELIEELKVDRESGRTSESSFTDVCQSLDTLKIHSLLTGLRKSG